MRLGLLFEDHLMGLMPEVVLSIAAFATLLIGTWTRRRVDGVSQALVAPGIGGAVPATGALAVAALAIAFAILAMTPWTPAELLHGALRIDALSQGAKGLILLASIGVIALSIESFRRDAFLPAEGWALFLLSALGLMILVSAQEMLTLYLGLELSSFCFYILAALKRTSGFSTEAGLKYFMVGALASGLLLFGIVLLYAVAGSTRLDAIGATLAASPDVWSNGGAVGLLFVMSALFFKVAAAPFHLWVADVYEGAPTPVAAFFAVVPKVAIFVAFARITLGAFHGLLPLWQPLLAIVSGLSMIVAAFAALRQTKIKRLLAYSAIGHAGYLLMGLACGTVEGVAAVFVYLAVYVITGMLLWGIVMTCDRWQWTDQGFRLVHLSDLAVLMRANPLLGFALALGLFSIAGVPPLAGFFAKMSLFTAAVNAGLTPLAVIGLLSSCVSAFYYLRVIKLCYFETSAWVPLRPLTAGRGWILGGCLLILVIFGAYPTPLLHFATSMAASLPL